MTESTPRFEPLPYASQGRLSLLGLLVLLVCMLLGGLLVGGLAAFIGQSFYLAFIFPIGIGCGILAAGYVGVTLGKVHNPILGAAAGILGGLFATLVFHYGIYLSAIDATPGLPPQQRVFLMFSPSAFARFMDSRARAGVRLSHTLIGVAQSDHNLGYLGSYLYWLIEAAIAAGIALAGTMAFASHPFCRSCNRWKLARPLLTLEGFPGDVVAALKDGDLARLAAFNPGGPTSSRSLLLTAALCPRCGAGQALDVKLEHVTVDDRGAIKRQELLRLHFPPTALAAFQTLTAAAATDDGRSATG
jgi:hypothetical protein